MKAVREEASDSPVTTQELVAEWEPTPGPLTPGPLTPGPLTPGSLTPGRHKAAGPQMITRFHCDCHYPSSHS